MTKNWKKISAGKKIKFFFLSKTAIYLSLGLHKVCPSYRKSLQLTKEAIQHFKTWIFSSFVGHFCPPGSGSGFRIRIRIHWPDWIQVPRFGSQSGSSKSLHSCTLPCETAKYFPMSSHVEFFLLNNQKYLQAGIINDDIVRKMPSRGRKRFVSEGDGGLIKDSSFWWIISCSVTSSPPPPPLHTSQRRNSSTCPVKGVAQCRSASNWLAFLPRSASYWLAFSRGLLSYRTKELMTSQRSLAGGLLPIGWKLDDVTAFSSNNFSYWMK